jgi:8-oxo-dGTP pyrophosphatase MutT (NUDIX family)
VSGDFAFLLTVAALQARIADPLRLRADRPAPQEDVERAARAGGRMTPAAVLVPIILHPEPTVLLTLRSADLKAHAGQVSFPGGRLEEGEDPVTAALREAEEEIGLHSSLPEIVGELPPLLTGTGYLVTPVVALLRPPFALKPDPGEVAETFEYPLAHVTDPAKPERLSREFRGETREFWVWPHERHYIWGATASVLVTLASVLRED